MNEAEFIFNVFDRSDFTYRLDRPDAQETKNDYTRAWNKWKEIVSEAVVSSQTTLTIDGTETWQNSGSLSKRFWSRIKQENRKNSSSCIAAMINKENLRVYLEWHNYKGKDSSNTLIDHNNWMNFLDDWIKYKKIDTSVYQVWTSKQEDIEEYMTLSEFLNDQEAQLQMLRLVNESNKEWIRVGLLYSKEQLVQLDPVIVISNGINDLEWLYEKTVPNNKSKHYWLFNIYFSQNTTVWHKSKQNMYVAMQYEKGKENNASITRNINQAKKVKIGDVIIAYTGNKGFLGYGLVTEEFYNEKNPSKFLGVNGDPWRQRIGVKWIIALDKPVFYMKNDFIKNLGITNKAALSSYTILEIPEEGFNFVQNIMPNSIGSSLVVKKISSKELVDHIHNFIKTLGFIYRFEDIKNLFLSLRSKPFVILSGISGTGKTKIVELFAESIGANDENGRFKLIPVRPDWSDSSDLLGYTDIQGKFKQGPLTEVLLEAGQNLDKPYFVLLDEMNLARVEYYFSDILSVMESRKWNEEGQIVTSELLPFEVDGQKLTIPENVYFIGTVNMDETTHPFSKKVLDRANTIEFNHIQLDAFPMESLNRVKSISLSNEQLMGAFLQMKDAFSENEDLVREYTARLIEINKILSDIGAQVGYRVRDEISFYMIYNQQSGLLDEKRGF